MEGYKPIPEKVIADDIEAAKFGKPVGTITIPGDLIKDGSQVMAFATSIDNGVIEVGPEVTAVANVDVEPHIRKDYDVNFDENTLNKRASDKGFVFNEDNSSLIYFYNVDNKVSFDAKDILWLLNAVPKAGKELRPLDGKEKAEAYKFFHKDNTDGFSIIYADNPKDYYRSDGYFTEMLDLIEPVNFWGDQPIFPKVNKYDSTKRNNAGFYIPQSGGQEVNVDVTTAVPTLAIPERNGSAAFDIDGDMARVDETDETEYGILPGSIQRRFLVNTNYVFNTKLRGNIDGSTNKIEEVENLMNVYFVGYTALPPAPVAIPKDNGGATVSLSGVPYHNEIVQLTVEYTKEDDTKGSVTAKKIDGNWELETPVDGVTIDPTTGTITFVPDAVKDNSPITSTVKDNLGKTSKAGEGVSKYDILNPEITFVKDPAKLMDEEKTMVEEAVRTANPNLPENTKVEVSSDGSVVVTYPDGNVETFAPEVTVRKIPTTEIIEVVDTNKLTDEEKTKVADKLNEKNPDLPKDAVIDVAENGKVTVTYLDGTTIEITPDMTVKMVEKVKEEPKAPENKSPENKSPMKNVKKENKTPNTGDSSSFVFSILSLIVSGGLIGFLKRNKLEK